MAIGTTDVLATITPADREAEPLEALDVLARWTSCALVRLRQTADEERWLVRRGRLCSYVDQRFPLARRITFDETHARTEARLWAGLPTLYLCPAHRGWETVRPLLAGYGLATELLDRVVALWHIST